MKWENAIEVSDYKYEIPKNWLHIHYYDAMNKLFRIENLLRVFVYAVLKSEYQEKWIDLNISTKKEETITIKSIYKKRKSQDQNFAYIGYLNDTPMFHLTSGELINIIFSDNYWKHFKKYFPGSKEIINHKLNEINNIRNSFAHFRPIKKDDLEILSINSKQLLKKIDNAMVELINCGNNVPTNTPEEWYKSLSELKSENIRIEITQSKDMNWIDLNLKYDVVKLNKINPDSMRHSIQFINLDTSNILTNFEEIKNKCIYISEEYPSDFSIRTLDSTFTKNINIVFNMERLKNDYLEIRESIEGLMNKIESEIIMFKKDARIKGSILSLISVFFSYNEKKERYNFNTSLFSSNIEDGYSEAEYWGHKDYIFGNFTIDSNKFPWMSEDISSQDIIPF